MTAATRPPFRVSRTFICAGLVAALLLTSTAGMSSAARTAGEDRDDAVVLSIGLESPTPAFVAGERVAFLEDDELLVWIDPTSPGDVETVDIGSAVADPVATADAVFVPTLFAVSEIALEDGTESLVYELPADYISSVSAVDATDALVAVGTDDVVALYDRGNSTPRWSVSNGGAWEVVVTPGAVIAFVSDNPGFHVEAFAIDSGESLWVIDQFMLDDVVALDESSVALATSAEDVHNLQVVDTVTGAVAWTQTSIPDYTSVALIDGTLVVTRVAGAQVQFIDPTDGTIIAEHDLGVAPVWQRAIAHPTLGAVIVDEHGTVYGFDPATGEPTIEPFTIGDAPASDEPVGLGPATDIWGLALAGDMLYVTLDGRGFNTCLIVVDLAQLTG